LNDFFHGASNGVAKAGAVQNSFYIKSLEAGPDRALILRNLRAERGILIFPDNRLLLDIQPEGETRDDRLEAVGEGWSIGIR
jgi:hypothetical protein